MIKDTNITVRITLSKKQYAWLEKIANDLHCSKSKAIAWILSKKANEISEYLKRMNKQISDEDFDEIIRIAHTPWIKE